MAFACDKALEKIFPDLFLYCYERDFMANLQKSNRIDLIDKFNDTSLYLDDIFTIDNPAFPEHIPDIYPKELQLNKANTSDKETSFLDLNIKMRCCTSVFGFHSNNFQITSKLLTQGYRYHKLRKTFGKFLRSYSDLLSKDAISFQEYVSKGITHPVFYGDLVYKLMRVKEKPNFILSVSKIVRRLRRRQYDPVIIERTISLLLGPFTAVYRSFL